MSEQLGLFGDSEPPAASRPVGPATVEADLLEVAAHLPAGIHLGTSSWNFPAWATLVYDRMAEERTLAREGLTAYSEHPLLRCVGIDRTFYGPISAGEFRRYAEQVPAKFRFVVKAPMLCTATTIRGEPGTRFASNPRFLDVGFALEEFVGPCLDGLGDHVGALVFQFPPVGPMLSQHPQTFAEKLQRFLEGLPRGPLYSIELRDRDLITPAYLHALSDVGAHHCIGLHPRMPVVSEQARITGVAHTGPLIVRWNLHQGLAYGEAKERYQPFRRLVDEDIPNRVSLARLCLQTVDRGMPAFVIANNKAEGCAPLTLFKLAEQIVLAAQHRQREA